MSRRNLEGTRTYVACVALSLLLGAAPSAANPIVTSINPDHSTTGGGVVTTITGTGFVSGATVHIGGKICTAPTVVGSTSVSCTVPSGVGAAKHVVVTAGGGSSAVDPQSALFSYDAPIVHAVVPNHGPTAGGSDVTVTGQNFGVDSTGVSAMVGEQPAKIKQFIPAATPAGLQSIVLQTPAGAGEGLPVKVLVLQQSSASSAVAVFGYDQPTVLSIAPPNGPTAGGAVLTIRGTNFGDASTAAVAMLNGERCSQTVFVGPTELHCVSPPGSGVGRVVAVELEGQAVSNASVTFSYDAPVLLSVEPAHAPADGNVLVEIFGKNLEPPASAASNTPAAVHGMTVMIGDQKCAPLYALSAEKAKCMAPAGVGAGLPVRIGVGKASLISPPPPGQLAAPVTFKYDAPLVSGVTPSHGPAGGGQVLTIHGLNFGAAAAPQPTVTVGAEACSGIKRLSDSELECTTPRGAGAHQPVTVRVGGQNSELAQQSLYAYDMAKLLSIVPAHGPTNGTNLVTILGTDFGAGTADKDALMVTIGGKPCQMVKIKEAQLICLAPGGIGKDVKVIVLTNGEPSVPLTYQYDAPIVMKMMPDSSPAEGGTTLTIMGTDFGPPGTSVRVQVGHVPLKAEAKWQSATSILGVVPPGVGATQPVTVEVGGQLSMETAAATLRYNGPQVSLLTPATAPLTGGKPMLISGLNFGAADLSPTVRVGSTLCKSTQWRNDVSLICFVPPGRGVQLPVTVTLASQKSEVSPGAMFGYVGGKEQRLTPDNGPTGGGTIVTITGTGFNRNAKAYMNGVPLLPTTWISETSVSCATAPGTGTAKRIMVTEDDTPSSIAPAALFSYDPPQISWIYPKNGPARGWGQITVIGQNFGVTDSTPSVLINNQPCVKSRWSSAAKLLCTVPAGYGDNLVVSAVVGGQPSARGAHDAYQYDTQPIYSVEPPHGPVSGGQLITVLGMDFGSNGDAVEVMVEDRKCQQTMYVTQTELACVTPFGMGVDQDITVKVSDKTFRGVGMFTFDAPVVTYVEPERGPPGGGDMVFLSGSNFGYTNFDPLVSLGGKPCTNLTYISDNSLTCVAPPGIGANKDVSVNVTGQTNSAAETKVHFSYFKPLVNKVVPIRGATNGGTTVTVHGENFGTTDSTPTASIGETRCGMSKWVSDTEVLCEAPAGSIKRSHYVYVDVSEQSSDINYEAVFRDEAKISSPPGYKAKVRQRQEIEAEKRQAAAKKKAAAEKEKEAESISKVSNALAKHGKHAAPMPPHQPRKPAGTAKGLGLASYLLIGYVMALVALIVVIVLVRMLVARKRRARQGHVQGAGLDESFSDSMLRDLKNLWTRIKDKVLQRNSGASPVYAFERMPNDATFGNLEMDLGLDGDEDESMMPSLRPYRDPRPSL